MDGNVIYFRRLRKQKELTLRDLAIILKCSIPHVSMYENGHCRMAEEKVKAYREYISKA